MEWTAQQEQDFFTAKELLSDAIEKPIERQTQVDTRRLRGIMLRLGYETSTRRIKGKMTRGYQKAVVSALE